MSLIEYSPETHSIVTVSIHFYERDDFKVCLTLPRCFHSCRNMSLHTNQNQSFSLIRLVELPSCLFIPANWRFSHSSRGMKCSFRIAKIRIHTLIIQALLLTSRRFTQVSSSFALPSFCMITLSRPWRFCTTSTQRGLGKPLKWLVRFHIVGDLVSTRTQRP